MLWFKIKIKKKNRLFKIYKISTCLIKKELPLKVLNRALQKYKRLIRNNMTRSVPIYIIIQY